MNKEEIFSAWAPDNAIWSHWAKPVLFAHLDLYDLNFAANKFGGDVSWAPPVEEKVVLVLDLPGAEGVLAGIELARRGYRPVPLYNAVPHPYTGLLVDLRPVFAVNVWPIITALKNNAEQLSQMNLPVDAPPAFLLDADRQGEGLKMRPGEFDNRSISFTTDFPSANFLASHGIERAILVQKLLYTPRSDLAHTLRRWQDGGIRIERVGLETPATPQSYLVSKPSWYGMMFQRALASIGLRRLGGGAFGAWVPDSSSGG